MNSSDRALGEAGSPPNPFALNQDPGAPPPVPASIWGPLSEGAWADVYRAIGLPHALASPEIISLGAFLSWENEQASAKLVPEVLFGLGVVPFDHLHLITKHADQLLYIEDSHCRNRLRVALNPSSIRTRHELDGLIELALSGTVQEIIPLLQLVRRIADRSSVTAEQIAAHIAAPLPAGCGDLPLLANQWCKATAALRQMAAAPGASQVLRDLAGKCAALAPPALPTPKV